MSGAFQHVNQALAATPEGVVRFGGLGQFHIRQLKKAGDAGTSDKRIVFRRAGRE